MENTVESRFAPKVSLLEKGQVLRLKHKSVGSVDNNMLRQLIQEASAEKSEARSRQILEQQKSQNPDLGKALSLPKVNSIDLNTEPLSAKLKASRLKNLDSRLLAVR